MSEAQDAEREVEELFNKEILELEEPDRAEVEMPTEGPPEPKPVDEVTVDEEEERPDEEEEAAPEEPDEEEAASEPEAPAEEVEPAEEDLIADWARRKFGEDTRLETEAERKLAKAAYEQEKLLGKKAAEAQELRAQQEERELQERIDALNTPGVLTSEEDGWVDEAILADDPGSYAYDALQAGRPDLYAAVMDRWASQGEQESRMARILHSRVMQAVSQPLPSEQESYTAALGETFVSLGLDIEAHGPRILEKAEELGAGHPSVAGMMSPDPDIRRIATRAIYDLVATSRTSVVKARTEDTISDRVREEQLRQAAAGVQQGGPRQEQPKKSPFWEEFEEELEERGWNGNRPSYGEE